MTPTAGRPSPAGSSADVLISEAEIMSHDCRPGHNNRENTKREPSVPCAERRRSRTTIGLIIGHQRDEARVTDDASGAGAMITARPA